MSGLDFNIRVDANANVKARMITPRQVERVNRLVVNKLVRAIAKETGGTVPRLASTSVLGFRRNRLFRGFAKARRKSTRGTVWLGGNDIAAKFGGKMRNVSGGARAGRHYFGGSFMATMRNGYTSIWHKNSAGDLVQDKIRVPDVHGPALRALANNRDKAGLFVNREIEKVISKNVNG